MFTYTQNIFYVKNFFFKLYNMLHVLKTQFDCFNSQLNNLDDMEYDYGSAI